MFLERAKRAVQLSAFYATFPRVLLIFERLIILEGKEFMTFNDKKWKMRE